MGNMTTGTSSKNAQTIMFCDFCTGESALSMGGLAEQVDYIQGNRPDWGVGETGFRENFGSSLEGYRGEPAVIVEEGSSKEDTNELSVEVLKMRKVNLKKVKRKGWQGPSKHKVPFLEALVRGRKHKEMREFIKIFPQLKLNLPLYEFLLQVPNHGRHLNDMITKKDKLHDASTHLLGEGKVPTKRKEQLKKAKEGRRSPSKIKAEFMKWVLVLQSKESKATKDRMIAFGEGTLES
ncbi:hypothetical protein M9H77_03290 [Catharanthus roseus]|uniref:Uncharacterized protein n=1 Tax=Catharanthus roseus TaxID=4058 RepID=A0ACC0CB30_CATRO|nr:hypothetical protein M9H77_03290 [Catharanthus roseus]